MKKQKPKKKSRNRNQAFSNNSTIQQLSNIFLFLFILFLPTQFGKHFFFDFSYLSGIRVDYLAPTIYVTDILALLLFLLNLRSLFNFFRQKKILILLSLLLFNILTSLFPPLSVYRSLKILELISIVVVIKQAKISAGTFFPAFFASGLLELFISVYQFINKHSLQGIFYFFGERQLNLSLPSIAKASLDGVEILRPYGTFSHPNSLGGFYLLVYLIVLTSGKKLHFIFKNFVLLICSILIFLSFSKIAIITYLIVNIIYIFKSSLKKDCRICFYSRLVIFSLLSFIFLQATSDPLSLEKRLQLMQNAFLIIIKHPLIGVGLGNYLIAQNQFPQRFTDFLNQPVHNIFLLLFSEIGIIISVCLITLFWKEIKYAVKKGPYLVFAILITGLFDHYWLTLQQNFLLIGVILGML